MVLMSGISYTYTFDWFQECGGINVEAVQNGLEIDVLLFGLGIVTVLGQYHQIAVIPAHNIHIPLQTVRCSKADVISPKAESCETSSVTEDGLMAYGFCIFEVHRINIITKTITICIILSFKFPADLADLADFFRTKTEKTPSNGISLNRLL